MTVDLTAETLCRQMNIRRGKHQSEQSIETGGLEVWRGCRVHWEPVLPVSGFLRTHAVNISCHAEMAQPGVSRNAVTFYPADNI